MDLVWKNGRERDEVGKERKKRLGLNQMSISLFLWEGIFFFAKEDTTSTKKEIERQEWTFSFFSYIP